MTEKSRSLLNALLLRRTSSPIASGLIKKPTKMQVKKATTGIITLLLIKSMKSRIERFRILTKLNGPNPIEEGAPRISAHTATVSAERFRVQCSLSQIIETIVSIREMEEVSAANNTRRKNTAPINSPKGMFANTFGSVTNIRRDLSEERPCRKRRIQQG